MKCLHFGLCQLVPLCLISASLAASSQPMDIAYLVPLPEKKEGSGHLLKNEFFLIVEIDQRCMGVVSAWGISFVRE